MERPIKNKRNRTPSRYKSRDKLSPKYIIVSNSKPTNQLSSPRYRYIKRDTRHTRARARVRKRHDANQALQDSIFRYENAVTLPSFPEETFRFRARYRSIFHLENPRYLFIYRREACTHTLLVAWTASPMHHRPKSITSKRR